MGTWLPGRLPPLTAILVAASIVAGLLTRLGGNADFVYPLLISVHPGAGLPEIRHGELWRLITPIFLHFGLLHIVFNMLWLWDLGGVIELRQGPARLGLLVLAAGVAGNLAEYAWSGPAFGGMSGVVYALLGYVWAQGRFNPRAGLALHQPVVVMMLLWFVVCWLGLVGNIANMAHTVGLVTGLVLGRVFAPRRA